MYIFEAIAKLFIRKPKVFFEEETPIEKCSHLFMAIDSTADYLACKDCGLVIKNPKK